MQKEGSSSHAKCMVRAPFMGAMMTARCAKSQLGLEMGAEPGTETAAE